jgi:COP9 signalosome complex subunit 4
METLTRTLESAVASKDFGTIQSVFRGNINSNNNSNQHVSSSSSTTSWLSIGQGEQRSLAAYLITSVVKDAGFLESSMNALCDTYTKVLQHLPATVENAADNTLRNALFHYMVNEQEDYAGAAKMLSSLRMNDQDSVYQITPAEKTDIYVKIAECYLAIDEIVESDSAVQKAGIFVEQISNKEQHTALILRYKSTYARILDANRKFLTAASRYHELSQSSTEVCIYNNFLQCL